MSKRLRASTRAANKGRNLRPRTSQPHAPVATPSQPPEAAAQPLSSNPPPMEEQAPAEASAQPERAEISASNDLRARVTEREPAVAARVPDDETKEDEPAAPEPAATEAAPTEAAAAPEPAATEPAAEPAPAPPPVTAQPEASPPSDTQPSAPALVEKEAPKATQAEVPAASESFKPTKATQPLAEESNALAVTMRTEAPKLEPATVEAPKAKVVEEPRKIEEPKKAAPKAEEPRKVEEPKKAAPKAEEPRKVEEPKKAAPKAEEPRKVEEPKKAAPKAEEPRKAKDEPKSVPSKKMGRADVEPASRKPASLRAVPHGKGEAFDDELDPSSISAQFFRKDQDSVPPVEEHDEPEDVAAAPILSPAALARRARLRRMVAGVVACAGVISIAVVGKAVFASKRAQAPMAVAVMEVKHDPTPPAAPAAPAPPATQKPAAEPQKVAVAEPAKADDKKADDKKPEDAKADDKKPEDTKADDKKPEDAKKDEKPAPSGADADALRKETLSLLNRGREKEAADKAKELDRGRSDRRERLPVPRRRASGHGALEGRRRRVLRLRAHGDQGPGRRMPPLLPEEVERRFPTKQAARGPHPTPLAGPLRPPSAAP